MAKRCRIATDGWGWMREGRWFIRDDAAQASGDFPQNRGSWLRRKTVISSYNYESDDEGRWFFQNGIAQQVYVELECTPWIWQVYPDYRCSPIPACKPVQEECLLDEEAFVSLTSDSVWCTRRIWLLAAEAIVQRILGARHVCLPTPRSTVFVHQPWVTATLSSSTARGSDAGC